MTKVLITTMLIGVLFLSGCSALPKTSSALPESVTSQDYTVKGLKAAIELGLSLKCSYTVNDITYEGYVKGKQWRGKVNMPQIGIAEVIINEDGCMYNWNETSKQGVKMCFDPAEMWESEEWGNEEYLTDIEYKCSITAVDDSMFTPPSDITFIDPMGMF
jgi:hypothetical protein